MNIERYILEQLDLVHPRLLGIATLWSEVKMEDSSVTYSAFKKAVTRLEQKEQMVVITGEDRNKGKITAAGQARLAE